jgi:S1-C subfamily serine protease
MKKLLLLLLFVPLIGIGQDLNVLNAFKFFKVDNFTTQGKVDAYGIERETYRVLKSKGLIGLDDNSNYQEVENLCDIATIRFYINNPPNNWNCGRIGISILSCENIIIYDSYQKTPNVMSASPYIECYNNWYRSINNHFKNFVYNYDSTLNNYKPIIIDVENTKENEESIVSYLDENRTDDVEGIYKNVNNGTSKNYKIGIKKYGYKYKGIILETSSVYWKVGEVKFILEPTAVETIFSIKYFSEEKTEIELFAKMENAALLEIEFSSTNKLQLIKLYPSNILSTNSNNNNNNNKWNGNGSGILISKSGYLVTNNHVIEKASKIEVEFIYNDEVKNFNAEVIQVDKINDLAILKIHDMAFDGLHSLDYNFNLSVSEVGTKVYAFGYPMALSIMGKELKVTDGIISSKTGFDGNITTYQITAPIQGGNSGGPLFDDKGNLVGINSSGIRKDLADNVGYSIKSTYVKNLIDVLPKSIELPSSKKLQSLPLTEQIKILSKYVVLIKVK